ncbi:MAG: enoyl-CoA hydratase-related protein [Candidatus Aminicenantes bacterium]
MGFENVIVNKEDGLGFITVNRPDKLNALNAQTVEELHEAFLSFQEDSDVKAVILTGSGDKAFIAGADIGELAELDAESGRAYVLRGQELTKLVENFPKPVIAAVNGFALGGGTEVALACHVRVVSENAQMGQPEVKLGLIPGYGGTQRLARLVGKGQAMELILTGKTIDAQQAFQIGLVNRVVPQGDLLSTCRQMAQEIIKNAPLAVEYAIRAINQGLDNTLDEGLVLEADLFGKACSSDDSKEGTQAFLEKRKAEFKGQ